MIGSAAEAFFSCTNSVSITLHLVNNLHIVHGSTGTKHPQLLSVPQPSVQRLDLTAFETEPLFLHSVFRTFPSITHLRIALSNLSERHLFPLLIRRSNLGESGTIEAACLSLKHLTIESEFNEITAIIRTIALLRRDAGILLESVALRGIPVNDDVRGDILELGEVIPQLDIRVFARRLEGYGDPADSGNETSSGGDWASGDEEVARARRKYDESTVG